MNDPFAIQMKVTNLVVPHLCSCQFPPRVVDVQNIDKTLSVTIRHLVNVHFDNVCV